MAGNEPDGHRAGDHLKGLSFDLEVENLFNKKEAMSAQFNLSF